MRTMTIFQIQPEETQSPKAIGLQRMAIFAAVFIVCVSGVFNVASANPDTSGSAKTASAAYAFDHRMSTSDGRLVGSDPLDGANPVLSFNRVRLTEKRHVAAESSSEAALAAGTTVCVQSTDAVFVVNLKTGLYTFTNCNTAFGISGRATIVRRGCVVTATHITANYKVLASIDTCRQSGTASFQVLPRGSVIAISDKDLTNNFCGCNF